MANSKSKRKFDKVILVEILLTVIAIVLAVAALRKTSASAPKNQHGNSPFDHPGSFSRVSATYKYGDLSLIPSQKVSFLNFGKNEDYFVTNGKVNKVKPSNRFFYPDDDESTAFAKSFGFESIYDMTNEHGWLEFFDGEKDVAIFAKNFNGPNYTLTVAHNGKTVKFIPKTVSGEKPVYEHAAVIGDTLLIVTKYRIVTVDLSAMDEPQLSKREFKDSASYAAIYCEALDKDTVATLYRGSNSSVLVTEASDGSTVAKTYIEGSALAMKRASNDSFAIYSAAIGKHTDEKDLFNRIDVFDVNPYGGSEAEFKESIHLPDALSCSVITERLFVEYNSDRIVYQNGDISVAVVLSEDKTELVTIAIDTSENLIKAMHALSFGERELAGFAFDY